MKNIRSELGRAHEEIGRELTIMLLCQRMLDGSTTNVRIKRERKSLQGVSRQTLYLLTDSLRTSIINVKLAHYTF